MLMDFWVSKQKQQENEALVLSHFFQHTGGELHRNLVGMFRTLLFQFSEKDEDLLSHALIETSFVQRSKVAKPGRHWNWTEAEIRVIFDKCVQR